MLRKLRADYAKRLPLKLDDLSAAIRNARSGSELGLREASELAHQLKGTAGSYGFKGVSSALKLVDEILHDMCEGAAPRPEDWAALERAVARAQASLA